MNVNISWSNKMFVALAKVGAPVRYTVYAGGVHAIGGQTYQPELYDWFLAQRRGHPAQKPTTQPTRMPAVAPQT